MRKRFKGENSSGNEVVSIPKVVAKNVAVQKNLDSFFKVVSKVEAWKKLPSSAPKDLVKIYCWNVNGIRSIVEKAEFANFMRKEDPDILCFNETKIDDAALSKTNIRKEFEAFPFQYWNCSKPPKRGYSGCAVLSKVKPVAVNYDLGVKKHDREGRTITVEYEKFILVTVYVPNAGLMLKRHQYRTMEWDIDFRGYVERTERERNKPVIICGDLNCAHKDMDICKSLSQKQQAGLTPEERTGFGKLLESGYVDTFRQLYPRAVKYSFWNTKTKAKVTNEGWRIDYFLISSKAFSTVLDSEILCHYDGSDHCPIKLSVDIKNMPVYARQEQKEEQKNIKCESQVEDKIKGDAKTNKEANKKLEAISNKELQLLIEDLISCDKKRISPLYNPCLLYTSPSPRD
eukprot:TRINITY_DN11163_c0_g1_i18.p1 TRINITY_DN11163_c0_g1~~TRINITY_DN11163_c0_g1_i18.p1  ORF type:complete len:401 (-),score=93.79 TRINITY_DN11163_c0_g1_i18:53-1255(-)